MRADWVALFVGHNHHNTPTSSSSRKKRAVALSNVQRSYALFTALSQQLPAMASACCIARDRLKPQPHWGSSKLGHDERHVLGPCLER